jgi:uncharacterized protein YcnI/phosphohistidine phosphatase SixA
MTFRLHALLVLSLAICGWAHMSVTPAEMQAGGRQTFDIGIAHDCGDETHGTSNFTIVIPDGLYAVTMELDPTWWTIVEKVPVNPPVTVGTTTYNETIRSVQYQGFLPDGYFKTYRVKVQAAMLPNSTKLYWKGYQECHGRGKPLAWDEIATPANVKPVYPAVPLTILNKNSTELAPTPGPVPVASPAPVTSPAPAQGGAGLHLHLHGPPNLYRLYKALREGGHVIFMRHAKTDVYGQDKEADAAKIENVPCDKQRNLSPAGIEATKETATSWDTLKIPVGQVKASPYCRTRDTARLLVGGKTYEDDSSLAPTDETTAHLGEMLREAFSKPPAAGTNTVLIGHVLSIFYYDGSSIDEGESVIAAPSAGGFTEAGRITMTQWGDLTRDYLAFGDKVSEMADTAQAGHAGHGGSTASPSTVIAGGTNASSAGPTVNPHAGH